MISLHILESNPLSVKSFANIFSHFIGCLIILFMVSSVVKMVSSLIRPHLFIFAVVCIILGNRSKKILLWFVSKCVLLMFSFRSFIVSALTVRSLTYFYLIFVHGIRECSSFILLYVAVQFSQHHLLRDCLFSIVYSFLLCCRLIDDKCKRLFLSSLSCSVDLCVWFWASTILLWLL